MTLMGRIIRLWVPVLILLHGGIASADLREIQTEGVLRVGTTGDYAPYSVWEETSQSFTGSDVEAAQALAKALGVQVRFIKTSWPALSSDLKAHRFDIAMGGISMTAERKRLGRFSNPYRMSGKVPLVRCRDQERLGSLQQIDQSGVRVIENPGGTNERFARQTLRNAQLIIHPENQSIFDELLKGHADVMLTDVEEAVLQQERHPELCAIHPEKPLSREFKGYWMPKENRQLQRRLNRWLSRIKL